MTFEIWVKVKFDSAVFVEGYQEIARRRQLSLGEVIGKDLQNQMSIYRDNNTGRFGKWLRETLGKGERFIGSSEEDFCFDPAPLFKR